MNQSELEANIRHRRQARENACEQGRQRFPFEWNWTDRSYSVLVEQQMEQSFPLEIFGKKGVTSDVFLFSRFYRNNRGITKPFASSHLCTMLLDEIHGLFPKVANGKNRSIWFPNGTTVLLLLLLLLFVFHTNGKRSRIVLFHLAENSHRFFHTNGRRSRWVFGSCSSFTCEQLKRF